MGNYFGTDGIRGTANTELSPELVFRLGRYGGYVMTRNKKDQRAKVVIGRDTRVSGEMLEAALVAGLLSIGADVYLLGVLPTPGVAYMTRELKADVGIMISASHNPLEDNGIKFFGWDGFKLSAQLEAEIESFLDMDPALDHQIGLTPRPIGMGVGKVHQVPDSAYLYTEHLMSTVHGRMDKLKIVLDCANGAAYQIAPQLFTELGAEVVVLADQPDGSNINEACGSTHPECVREAVLKHQADVGLSFDGDADRIIAVDELGNIVDGDQILYILARYMKKTKRLNQRTVVSTVMSNLGLYESLQNIGIAVKKSNVGDRHVMEEMLRGGYNLGGEQSGHIIILDHATTGDGVLSAIQLVNIMVSESQPLSQLAAGMTKYPQLLVNVQVEDKHKVVQNRKIHEVIQSIEHRMGGSGRVLVRPSGTESIVRVMAEGPDQHELSSYVHSIVSAIKDELAQNAM